MIKLIAFDLDNVLIDGEAIDEIAKLMDVETEISQLTKKAMEGDLDFETSLKERINLLKGASLNDIKEVVNNMPLMEGAEETLKELKKRGYKIATITGNFEVVADRLKELKMDYVFCNVLHEENGVLTGEVSGPLMVEGAKAEVLQTLMDSEGLTAEECAAVGDGANDISMIQKAGLGVAFNAKPVVKEVADVIIENKDLRELLTIFNHDDKSETAITDSSLNKTIIKNVDSEAVKNNESESPVDKDSVVDKESSLNKELADMDSVVDKESSVNKELADKESSVNKELADEESSLNKEFVEKEPAVNKDAGKSFSQLLDEKKVLEKNLKALTQDRDKLNEEARTHKQLRDDLNSSIKENLDKALNYRQERDKINQDVKKYKKLRDEANQELKKMEWSSGRRDIMNIQDEIKRLDKTIETKVLDIRKENELVKKVTDLQKKLQTMQEDEKTRKESIELRERSESYHAKVVELSDQAQETHEQMLVYFQRIDEIRAKADEAHAQFIATREKASEKHDEVKAVLKEIRSKNKSLDKVKAKERYKEDKITEKKNIQEKEKAEEVYRKFLEGKKLSTDELLMLQRHNVV